MFRLFFCATMLFSGFGHAIYALEALPGKYLVTYGNPNASIKVIEYFSFQCPHCLALFRSDFKKIEDAYIESGELCWVFHPIPTDLVTVQGMACMANLTENQKRLFLETIFVETEVNSPSISALIMCKVMEIFGKPIPNLQEESFIEKSDAFMDAFNFLTQEEKIFAVPTIDVNSKLYPKDIPDFEFVQSFFKK